MEVPLPEAGGRESVLKEHEAAVAALQARVDEAKAAVAAAAGKVPDAGVPAKAGATAASDFPGVVVDEGDARKVGDWKISSATAGFIGTGYANDLNTGKGEKTITFQPELPAAGRYEVRLAYTAGGNRATNVPVTVFSADGEKTIEVNEQVPPPIDGHFVSLGQHLFEKNGAGFVLVSNEGTNGYVLADAVQFLPVDQLAAAEPGTAKRQADGGTAVAAAGTPTNPAARLRKLEADLKRMKESGPKRETVISVVEEPKIEDAQVHVRGSVHNLGPAVSRGFLSAVDVRGVPAPAAQQSGRRELALWLAARDNPLPVRVMANRVWHWLMGQGIVRTVDNFGTTGEAPSHPELLDHLAARFAEQGWSVKKLVREVVLSRAYRLSSGNGAEPGSEAVQAAAADPENRLCWRANRQRLDGEAIRDAMLAVGGRLDLSAPGGPTYAPTVKSDYGYKHAEVRRSVYVPWFRNSMPEIVEAFDAADPSVTTGGRNVSTVAPQALFMLNHPFVREQAAAAADRLLRDGPAGDGAVDAGRRADLAYQWALGRPPTAAERGVVSKYVSGASAGGRDAAKHNAAKDAWVEVFHALFASPDFRYVN